MNDSKLRNKKLVFLKQLITKIRRAKIVFENFPNISHEDGLTQIHNLILFGVAYFFLSI